MLTEFPSQVSTSVEELFAWHCRPGAFQRLQPPWRQVSVLERSGSMQDGGRIILLLKLAPAITIRWIAEHHDFIPNRQFCDLQIQGPFAYWKHTHRFEPNGTQASRLFDHIEYVLPGGPIGTLLGERP